MDSKYEQNAEKEVKKAQKALSGNFFSNLMSSKSERIDEAQ